MAVTRCAVRSKPLRSVSLNVEGGSAKLKPASSNAARKRFRSKSTGT